jgi:DNA polymerase-1
MNKRYASFPVSGSLFPKETPDQKTESEAKEENEREEANTCTQTLLLVDGNSLVNRAFFALPPFSTSKGQPTNAVYGFTNMLLKVLSDRNPSHVAVAFDTGTPTFRHVEYEEYKAHRTGMPDPLKCQMPIVKEVLDAFQIPIFELDGYEADDVIATIARKAQASGYDVLIVTGDRDAIQLVSPQIRVLITKKGISEVEEYDEEKVLECYGVMPERIADLKGLMGDTSDNIPGVPGIGEKTASRLIQEFGDLETLLVQKDEVKQKRVREALKDFEEQAILSKRLATLDASVPIDVDLENDCRRRLPDREVLLEVFRHLEFRSLVAKAMKIPLRPGSEEKSPGDRGRQNHEEVEDPGRGCPEETGYAVAIREAVNFRVISARDRLQMSEAAKNLRAALDGTKSSRSGVECGAQLVGLAEMEGTGVTASPVGLLLGVSDRGRWIRGYYIHDPCPNEDSRRNISDFMAYVLGVRAQRESAGHEVDYTTLIGYNLKPLLVFLLYRGVPVDPLSFASFDAEIAGYLLDPTRSTYYLEDLAQEHLDVTIPTLEALAINLWPEGNPPSHSDTSKGTSRKTTKLAFHDLPPEKQAWLMEKRAAAALALKEVMTERINEVGMEFLLNEVEMPLLGVLADMESTGVRVESSVLEEMGEELGSRLAEVASAIYEMAGAEFNINSTKQLSKILFEKMNLPIVKRTKTGYSTDAEVLETLSAHHDIADLLLEHRQIVKLKGTYVDGLGQVMDSATNRIHSTFNQAITATGRISSTEPNLQNIPIRLELGRRIRRVFIPSAPGNRLLACDYSQIELRVLAHVSEDPVLMEAFKSGEDIHRRTASEVFGVSPDEVTSQMRSRAKAVNFGIVYGISDFGLSKDIGVSKPEAAQYIENYFERYKGVRDYIDLALAKARVTGYATTILNRRRPIPDIRSRNVALRKLAERTAINTPIQGSAADIIKLAMVHILKRFRDEGLKSKMILQVHDELIFDVQVEEMDVVRQIVREEMEGVFALKVPLKVDLKWGLNWYDMEGEG